MQIGMHVQDLDLMKMAMARGDGSEVEILEDGPQMVTIVCRVGALAYSPRVQDPEKAKIDETVNAFAAELTEDQIDRNRKRALQRQRELDGE